MVVAKDPRMTLTCRSLALSGTRAGATGSTKDLERYAEGEDERSAATHVRTTRDPERGERTS